MKLVVELKDITRYILGMFPELRHIKTVHCEDIQKTFNINEGRYVDTTLLDIEGNTITCKICDCEMVEREVRRIGEVIYNIGSAKLDVQPIKEEDKKYKNEKYLLTFTF
jgi:hypothetical protein